MSDYTPRRAVPQKIKKTGETLTLELVRTPDILAEVAAQTGALKLVVGFAAETHDVEKYARGKLAAKRLDLIIANQVGVSGSGFESDDNAATAYWQGGERIFPSSSKADLAEGLLELISERLRRMSVTDHPAAEAARPAFRRRMAAAGVRDRRQRRHGPARRHRGADDAGARRCRPGPERHRDPH